MSPSPAYSSTNVDLNQSRYEDDGIGVTLEDVRVQGRVEQGEAQTTEVMNDDQRLRGRLQAFDQLGHRVLEAALGPRLRLDRGSEGRHITAEPERVLRTVPEVAACVLGEGEERIVELALPVGTRSEALTEEVLEHLYAAGIVRIQYAPESGSPATLKRIEKAVGLDDVACFHLWWRTSSRGGGSRPARRHPLWPSRGPR